MEVTAVERVEVEVEVRARGHSHRGSRSLAGSRLTVARTPLAGLCRRGSEDLSRRRLRGRGPHTLAAAPHSTDNPFQTNGDRNRF